MQIYKIFSRKVAAQLRQRGFKCLGCEPNWLKPQFDVYLFEQTDELMEALSEINQWGGSVNGNSN